MCFVYRPSGRVIFSLLTMSLLSRGSSISSSAFDLSQDRRVPEPPSDSVSCVAFSPVADVLSVASWDNKVRIYEVNPSTGDSQGRAIYEHQAPVLSTCWLTDGSKVVSGGCDNAVRVYDPQAGQAIQIGSHDAAVKSVCSVQLGSPMVASASWDKTLKYWDLRQPTPVSTVQLPERAYIMDTQKTLLVVGCAERRLAIIDLNSPQTIYRASESPLKMQTRSIACMPDGTGYAIASIEGRCAIQYVDDAKQSASGFSFRCHRSPVTTPKVGDNIFAVNAISFNPGYGTFSTAGSDGTVHFWDKEAKFRLRYSEPVGGAITSTSFNKNGLLFAYGISYDWSKGYQSNTVNYPTEVRVRVVKEMEVKPRPKKR